VVGSASIRASGGPNDILITFKAGVETQLKVRYNIVTLHIYGDLADQGVLPPRMLSNTGFRR
jgi:hypothetical protein